VCTKRWRINKEEECTQARVENSEKKTRKAKGKNRKNYEDT
jgi:hypothetical protein